MARPWARTEDHKKSHMEPLWRKAGWDGQRHGRTRPFLPSSQFASLDAMLESNEGVKGDRSDRGTPHPFCANRFW